MMFYLFLDTREEEYHSDFVLLTASSEEEIGERLKLYPNYSDLEVIEGEKVGFDYQITIVRKEKEKRNE
jgi:hypothetical protein